MIIRLDKKHYPQIIEIWESSVRATHHFLKPEEIGFYKPLVLHYALPENTLFGTCDNNRLTGFIGLRSPKVEMLFIHPDFFGQFRNKIAHWLTSTKKIPGPISFTSNTALSSKAVMNLTTAANPTRFYILSIRHTKANSSLKNRSFFSSLIISSFIRSPHFPSR